MASRTVTRTLSRSLPRLQNLRPSKKSNHLALAAGGVAALFALNWIFGRVTESRHPPTGQFITVRGVRLHYTEVGEGDPIVLIHGNSVTGTDWDISGVRDLLSRTHRVIVFDRPGSGYSERPRGRNWPAEQQAELFHEALEQLNVKDPVVCGHSFGALVALSYALRYEDEVKKLVLVSGYYFPSFRLDAIPAFIGALPVLGDILRYTISPFLTLLEMPILKRAMFAPLKPTPRFERTFSEAMVARPSQIRGNSFDGATMIPSVWKLRQDYETLELPVTIITGDSDKIVCKSNSERLNRYILGSALIVVPGAGHMVHHFVPADIASAIIA